MEEGPSRRARRRVRVRVKGGRQPWGRKLLGALLWAGLWAAAAALVWAGLWLTDSLARR